MCIYLVGCSGGEAARAVPLTGQDRADAAVQGAAPLSSQALRDTRTAVTPNRSPDPSVKVAKGRRLPLAAQHTPPLCHEIERGTGDRRSGRVPN